MSFNILTTPPFEKELKSLLKKYPSVKSDIIELVAKLIKEPKMGIAIGNDCYKIRMAITSKGKGKSGGARVITFVQIIETTIYLLSIYDKADTSNISDKILKERLKGLK
jgi:mRNA-degrading endonuclease RelE of RelBE toxin-antitoxin system